MSNFWATVTLIIAGVMLANAIANPSGTKAIFDGISGLWKVSVNGLLAVPSTKQ